MSVMGSSTEAEGRRELTQHGGLHVYSCGWRRRVWGGRDLYSDGQSITPALTDRTVLPVLARGYTAKTLDRKFEQNIPRKETVRPSLVLISTFIYL